MESRYVAIYLDRAVDARHPRTSASHPPRALYDTTCKYFSPRSDRMDGGVLYRCLILYTLRTGRAHASCQPAHALPFLLVAALGWPHRSATWK